VYHALDLASFQENIIGNSGTPATVVPNSPALYGEKPEQWNNYTANAPVYAYDVEKAKEYLAKSAYPDGFSANVIVNQSARYNDIALFMQESLRPLGIDIEIIKVTGEEHDNYYFGAILDADGKRDYDMLVGSWWADYADIGSNLPLYQPGAINVAAYDNAEVIKLLTEEAGTLDIDGRNTKIFEAFDIIIGDVPYIFVQYPNQQNVLNVKFTGLKANSATAVASLRFANVRLVQK
jgi:peptide/nickel transport system substrate-binding protein